MPIAMNKRHIHIGVVQFGGFYIVLKHQFQMWVLLRKALQNRNQPIGAKAWVGGDADAFGAVAIRQHFQRSVFD